MSDGSVKSMAKGLLIGAGALWAYGAMTRTQRARVTKMAEAAVSAAAKKVRTWTK